MHFCTMKKSILLILFFFVILNTLGQITPPRISGSSNALCNNTPITLNATGCNGTINWNNGSIGQSIVITQVGTYTAICTLNGVQSANSHPFIVNSTMSGVLHFTGQSNCSASDFELNAIGLPAGTYPQFYRNLQGGVAVQSTKITPSVGGNYIFTAFDKVVGNWNLQSTYSSLKINDIFFINAYKGWAVGSGGRIYYTSNGGQTWNTTYVSSSVELKSVYFVNETNGWCVGTTGKVYKSTNGGISWSNVTVSGLSNTDIVYSVHFIDSNTGWITFSNKAYKTTNAGVSWVQESVLGPNSLTDVYFVDNSTGWIITQSSTLYKTKNGGNTWENLSIIAFQDYLNDIHFSDANNGCIVGTNGYISLTNDGGQTWSTQNANTLANLTKVKFINKAEGWIVGEGGTILHTDDGGKSWYKQVLNSSESIYGIIIIDANSGWLAGDNGRIRSFVSTKKAYCPSNAVYIKQSPERPIISKVSCDTRNATLTVSNCTGDVSWSNGLTSQAIQVNQAGTYTAVCSVDGCVSTESKKEVLLFNNNLSVNANATCLSDSPVLSVSGIDENIKIEWRQNQKPFINDENTFTPTVAGSYDIVPYIEGERKWELKENDVLDNSLFAAAMADKNTGVAVGKYGSMLITRDGGKTWEQRSFIDYYFSDIQFVDENIGFVLGNKNSRPYILKTTDKGANWQIIDVNFPYQGFEGIYFVDSQTGWITGSGKSILKTTDGGLNWFAQAMDFGSGINFNSIFFIDSQKGWAVGNNGKVFITSDGGNNWFERSADTFYSLRAVCFVNQHKGFVVGERGEVFSSVDGGNSWTLISEISNRYATVLTRIQFVDELNGYIFGSSLILYTNDGGLTWGKRFSSIGGAHKMGAFLLDSQHGIIAGGGGTVAMTHDGTLSWIEKNVNVLDFKAVKFVDKFNGWALSDKSYAKTVDGGKTWTYHSLNNNETLIQCFFLNRNIGWLVTAGKKVFKTIDGGLTWNQMTFNVNIGSSFFSGVFFFDENNGWVVGTSDLALKTTDGGQNWTMIRVKGYSFTPSSFQKIYFVNRNKGWITEPNGLIYVTNDGGNTWQSQQLDTVNEITKIFFVNADFGWICARGDFFRTEDGGQTWYKRNFGINDLSSVHFSDTQNGWSLIGGFLNYSTDGGRNWQEIKSINLSTDLSFIDEKEIFLVGWNKQILTYGIEKKYLCSTTSIYIKNSPIPPVISSFSTIICSGKDLKLSSSNCTGNVSWSNGNTGQQLTVSTTGTYAAKCVENGCESFNSNIIMLEESTNCQPIEILPSVIYSCPNENITISLTGCPNNDVIWSNNATGASISIQVSSSFVIDAYCRSGGNASVPITVASRNLEVVDDIQKGIYQLRAIETLQARNKIQSLNAAPNHTQTKFLSGKSILLEPGFEVKPNATFIAQIRSCE